jgi:hypothetical protein
MSTEVKQQKTNYEIFIDTVNSLKFSQGFYSRIARDLDLMSDEQKQDIENELNNLPQWNDTLDCVLYLEQ